MILIPVLGGMFGTGAWLAYTGLRPARPPLVEHIRPTHPELAVATPTAAADGGAGWSARAGQMLAPRLGALGLPGARVRQDLAAMDVTVERLLAEKATAALAGLLLPLMMGTALTLTGTLDDWTLPVGTAPVLAAAAFFVPDWTLRSTAAAWRLRVRHALSAVLDLTSIALAGGTGTTQALKDAAEAADGPVFALFRRAVREAEITRTEPWGPLQALGRRLQINDLDELAGTIALAGSQGARVKDSLATKAASLRTHLLAEEEAEATAATEHMSIPVVVLFAAFLIMIGFPALVHVTSAL